MRFNFKQTLLIPVITGSFALSGLMQPTQNFENQSQENIENYQTQTNNQPQYQIQPEYSPNIASPNTQIINEPPSAPQPSSVDNAEWIPAPDTDNYQIPNEEPQKYVTKRAKKPVLGDYGAVQSSDIWSQEDEENQNIIENTQHRKREIDPAKRMDLIALSQVLGSLHALRISCTGAGDQTYRARMSALLDMEAPSATFIREPLTIAFNQGFQDQGEGANPCPNDNGKQEALFAKKGYDIAMKMSHYYTNLSK
jgi:uncharacterized protein (TIGR02301 family)